MSLRALRFPVTASRGRRYPELAHPYRNDFQRDRDRIVHARSFRRLEDKTQVFPPGVSDHFRNRLTHTIEVAQIARTVAAVLELDGDLTEALALAHDLGHPPFGHAGERELDEQMKRYGDRFDHNRHSLRIVESFEQRYARFPGLNLTFEVREGMAKHSRDFEPGEIPELDEFLPGLRPPLEAQLIDLTDEIAYNTADLDDGFSAGFFTAAEICAVIPAFADLHEASEIQFAGATERVQFYETLRRLVDLLASGLIAGTEAAVLSAGVGTVDDVRAYPERLATLDPLAAETTVHLKRFLHEHLYAAGELEAEREHSRRRVGSLFQFWMQSPPEHLRHTEGSLHRAVCDYLAGMTERFFDRQYEAAFGPTRPAP